MKLIIIAASSVNGVIGIGNDIPWHIPEDFKHYRETTMGHPVIVGLNTFKTLPNKALEGREYLVLCGEGNLFENDKNNVHLFERMADLMDYINQYEGEVYVAGGAMMYDQLIDLCDECIMTVVDIRYDITDNSKLFPVSKLIKLFETYNVPYDWNVSKNGLKYKFVKYKRND